MSKSLAELRASKVTTRPERTYSLCLAPTLVAEVQNLSVELDELRVDVEVDDERKSPPLRMGEGEPTRVAEIRARMAELWDQMDEHTGELRLRALTGGEWRQWVDDHPAREDNQRDLSVAYGILDGDALLDDLGLFTVAWNDDELAPGDWDFIAQTASPGDLVQIARTVVGMHESAVDLPKLRQLSLDRLKS